MVLFELSGFGIGALSIFLLGGTVVSTVTWLLVRKRSDRLARLPFTTFFACLALGVAFVANGFAALAHINGSSAYAVEESLKKLEQHRPQIRANTMSFGVFPGLGIAGTSLIFLFIGRRWARWVAAIVFTLVIASYVGFIGEVVFQNPHLHAID